MEKEEIKQETMRDEERHLTSERETGDRLLLTSGGGGNNKGQKPGTGNGGSETLYRSKANWTQ
jgi:hypothetical protein